MKRLIVLIASVFLLQTAHAQLLQFGVKAGLSSSTITADDFRSENGDLEIEAGDGTVGFHLGAMLRVNVPLIPLYVQPELLFTNSGGEIKVSDLSDRENVRDYVDEQRFNRIDLPIIVGTKLGPARLMLGPVASFIVSDDSGIDNLSGYESDFNGATWGFQAGVGVDILKKLTIDLKYEGNLSKLGDGVRVFGQERSFDSRNRQLILSAGWFF